MTMSARFACTAALDGNSVTDLCWFMACLATLQLAGVSWKAFTLALFHVGLVELVANASSGYRRGRLRSFC